VNYLTEHQQRAKAVTHHDGLVIFFDLGEFLIQLTLNCLHTLDEIGDFLSEQRTVFFRLL
jgi:hypothetical protein